MVVVDVVYLLVGLSPFPVVTTTITITIRFAGDSFYLQRSWLLNTEKGDTPTFYIFLSCSFKRYNMTATHTWCMKYYMQSEIFRIFTVSCSIYNHLAQGDIITAGQCRPLAKTVRFNVIKAGKSWFWLPQWMQTYDFSACLIRNILFKVRLLVGSIA